MHEVHQLLLLQIDQVVEVNATVRELAESALLLQLERRSLIIRLRAGRYWRSGKLAADF